MQRFFSYIQHLTISNIARLHCISSFCYFKSVTPTLFLANFLPLSSGSGIHASVNAASRVRVMMSPTCEWLWFVQEQHGYQVTRRAGLLCFPSSSPLLYLAVDLPVKLWSLLPLLREKKLEKEKNRRCISPAVSLCFTHGWWLIYCLSDWLTHWLLADRSACSSLVNINVKVRQRQAGGLAAEKLT